MNQIILIVQSNNFHYEADENIVCCLCAKSWFSSVLNKYCSILMWLI